MRETDFIFKPIGEVVDGYQAHRLETPTDKTYLVLPEGEDPNAEAKQEDAETVPPLEFTLMPSDEDAENSAASIQVDWMTDTGAYDFASVVDRYYIANDTNIVGGSEDALELIIMRANDESLEPSLREEVARPVDSEVLDGFLDREQIKIGEISSIAMNNRAGDFMWTPEDGAAALIRPSAFTDLGLGLKSLTTVYALTRDRETMPPVTVFQENLPFIAADSIFDGTTQMQPATV